MKGLWLGLKNLICCVLCLLLWLGVAGCQSDPPLPPPTPTFTPLPLVPTSTRQAALEALTPVAPPTATPTPTPEPDSGTVILWHSWSGADADALALILGEFQAAHPDLQIETLFVAYDRLPQAYADAVYAGGGPDLILAPSWRLQELAEAEVLLPLDDLLTPEQLAMYLPAAVENMRYEDRLYGVPSNFDVVTLYYNNQLITPEELPATTGEMLALAQAEPSQGVGLYANFYHLFWGIPAYGGTLFDEDGRVVLDQTEATAKFLTWLQQMSETPGVFVDLDYGMLIDRFKKGEFAFFIDGPWNLEELRGALGDSLGVALLPAGPAGPARPWLSADGAFLNPASTPAQQRMALMLATHLASASSGSTLAQVARRIPVHVKAQIEDPLLQGFVAQAALALPEPHRPEMTEVWGYAGDMILKVLNGVLSPAEAVLEATTLINEVNEKESVSSEQ